ncbi:MAG: aldo/keto reductase [Frankiales bacterium]|nr:aldo/keto reductase [Frankiales bacterium]
MQLRTLGRTGVKVSALCLGTMTFGNEADFDAAQAIVDRYLEAGGNFVDTADVYQRGAAEEITGRALGARRAQVVLATKGRMPMSDDPLDRGANRRHLTRAVEASLTRLGTDWIDLYQVHWPDPSVPIEDTLAALDDLVNAGKIRYVGLSNYLGWELQRGIDACERHGWAPIVSHQPQYSLISREIELETLPLCAANGIAVLPWSPLGGGVLTGKYTAAAAVPADSRLGASEAQAKRRLSEQNLQVAQAVGAVAEAIGKTSAQVALNWVLHRPGVTSPILGARNVGQLEDNLGAEGWELAAEQVTALDRASRLPLPYPHDMYRLINAM